MPLPLRILCSTIILASHQFRGLDDFTKRHQKLFFTSEKAILHSNFTQSCLDEKTIPNFLRCRLPQQLKGHHHLLRSGQLKTLKKVHHENKEAEARAKQNLQEYEDEIAASLSSYQLQLVRQVSTSNSRLALLTIKQRQEKKLEALKARATSIEEENPGDHIFNLSKRTLTKEEETALSYGMKMCWPQTTCDVQIKTEAEALYRKLKSTEPGDLLEVKTKLLTLVNTLCKNKTKVPRKIRTMMNTLKQLSKEDLYISRPDKGNGVVILDKDQYIAKMDSIINDANKFEEAKNTNHTLYIKKEKEVNKVLLDMKKQGEISQDLYRHLRSTGCQPSRLYGLPKIHKDSKDPPLRPILSMVRSYCDNISKWLLTLLKPFVPDTFSAKDSFVAQKKIVTSPVNNSDSLVSLDAISLFTSIPVAETIEHTLNLIPSDKIPFSKQTLKTLLEMCCTKVPFMFNGKNYIQIDGLSMGSSLAPIMAEFAMHMIESRLDMPKLYLRYVDDIIAVFNSQDHAIKFLNDMNAVNKCIKFTIESNNDNVIDFLDMRVSLQNNSLVTNWILKPTNTGLYTPKIAYSPNSYKKNAIKALYHRAQTLTCSDSDKTQNKEIVKKLFIQNGYHPSFIENCFNATPKIPDNENENKRAIYYGVPYIKECSMVFKTGICKINKKLTNNKIIPYFKTFKTQHFFHNKDKLSPNVSSSLVYKFQCEHCEAGYIGETRRHLQTRITEHIRGNPPSEISKHHHIPTPTNFKILNRTNKTKIAETLHIQKQKQNNSLLLNNCNASEPLFLFN